MNDVGVYNAGKCDACGCHLTLFKREFQQSVIGHDPKCKVGNSNNV